LANSPPTINGLNALKDIIVNFEIVDWSLFEEDDEEE
jgi:hypothetical protein